MKSKAFNLSFLFHVRSSPSHSMSPFLTCDHSSPNLIMSCPEAVEHHLHGVATRAKQALHSLIQSSRSQLPGPFIDHARNTAFLHGTIGDVVCFPCPLQEQEAAAALKALEGGAVAAIANLIEASSGERSVEVHLDRVTCFLMSAYLVTINGKGKHDVGIENFVRGWWPLLRLWCMEYN